MQGKKQPLDLSGLEDDYEITGELGGGGDARTFIATRTDAAAKRRDDRTGVLIEVVGPPAGDEGHALTHLAADTQVLMRTGHRRLMPVVEGRWIGSNDAYAVITQRTTDPSLAQVLATGQRFSNPRTAAILREINGLLEWAREQKIVHRNITTDRIYLEPKTDRVRVSFAVAPIPRIQRSEATDADARTIARLAMAMLTGFDDPRGYEGQSLGELRPDLPEQLLQATMDLLMEKTRGADVAAYLALVGMAEPLAAGETEAERLRDEILEEQLTEREKLAAERAAFERMMEEEREKLAKEREELQLATAKERDAQQQATAKEREELERAIAAERAALQRTMEEERAKLAKESAELQRTVERERTKLAKEREELQRAAADERAALVAKRAELERAVAAQRAEIERAAEEDRRRLAALRAEIQRAGELEVEKKREAALDEITDAESALGEARFATPLFVPPVIAPLGELKFENDSPLMREEDAVEEEVTAAPSGADATPSDVSVETGIVSTDDPSRRRRRLILSGAVAGGVAIAIASALVLGSRSTRMQPVAKPVARSTAPTPTPSAPVAAAPAPAVPLPTASTRMDSAAGSVVPSRDSSKSVAPAVKRKPKAVEPKAPVREAAASEVFVPGAPVRRDSAPQGDSLVQPRVATPARRDTVVKRDSGVPRPDSPTAPPVIPPA